MEHKYENITIVGDLNGKDYLGDLEDDIEMDFQRNRAQCLALVNTIMNFNSP
jgi:hypothetical protein